MSTMATSDRRTTQPGAATTAPRTGGAPATTATPPARASTPTAIAGATSGTTSRLTSGDSTARRPNETRMIGRVAACAASETPRLSASQPGIRPPPRRPIHSVSGVAQAISPAVARDESWNPASPISAGSRDEQERGGPGEGGGRTAGSPALARERGRRPPSAPRGPPRRTRRRTRHTARSRRSSRPTDGDARGGPVIAPMAAATIAMFQPEMATT